MNFELSLAKFHGTSVVAFGKMLAIKVLYILHKN